jgi:glycosyltransferase involved in cell wall biosynthesis
MNPLFSIITVSYNAEATIGRTLGSIDEQTFTDYEHLVVDGASTDGTTALVEKAANPARRLISEPDKGLYDAMNKGISRTNGQYLIFLNAGDKFHSPDTLATIARAIRENDSPGIVYGQTNIVDNEGNTLGRRHLTAPEKLTLASFADGMLVCHQAFVALRRICGTYDLRYRFSADYEWCIRCLQHSRHNAGLTNTVFIDYLNEGVTSSNKISSLLERFRIMAYYYGWLPTVARHIKFAGRALKRRLK